MTAGGGDGPADLRHRSWESASHLALFHMVTSQLSVTHHSVHAAEMPLSETGGWGRGSADRLVHLKRFTSSFSSRQVRGAGSGTESQLRVSWDSVLNAEQTGRWWIVGSAWSGAPMISSQQKASQKPLAGTVRTELTVTNVWLSPRRLPGSPSSDHLPLC